MYKPAVLDIVLLGSFSNKSVTNALLFFVASYLVHEK